MTNKLFSLKTQRRGHDEPPPDVENCNPTHHSKRDASQVVKETLSPAVTPEPLKSTPLTFAPTPFPHVIIGQALR